MKTTLHRTSILLFFWATIHSPSQATDAKVEGDIIVMPRRWQITAGRSYGKVLLAWQITNLEDRYIRFRKRNLGFVKILDNNLHVIKPVMLGVDSTRPFQASDYQLIGPNETIYFPFAITFMKNVGGSYSIKIKSNSDGDEGWVYENLKEGEYTMVVRYSAIQHHGANDLLRELEMQFVRENHLNSFWKGEIESDGVRFTIAGAE